MSEYKISEYIIGTIINMKPDNKSFKLYNVKDVLVEIGDDAFVDLENVNVKTVGGDDVNIDTMFGYRMPRSKKEKRVIVCYCGAGIAIYKGYMNTPTTYITTFNCIYDYVLGQPCVKLEKEMHDINIYPTILDYKNAEISKFKPQDRIILGAECNLSGKILKYLYIKNITQNIKINITKRTKS